MKAAKYIIATDHRAGFGDLDEYIRLNATTDLKAMAEAAATIENMENLYCTTIYKLVPGTKGKDYRPMARNYGHGGFYVAGAGSWDTKHHLERFTTRDDEWYETHLDY